MFSFIGIKWRGKPLTSHQTVIELIAATTTRTGLKVYARLDENAYPDKIKITDQQLAQVQIHGDPFHREWTTASNPDVNTSGFLGRMAPGGYTQILPALVRPARAFKFVLCAADTGSTATPR